MTSFEFINAYDEKSFERIERRILATKNCISKNLNCFFYATLFLGQVTSCICLYLKIKSEL
jgi:hypothetical protein